MPTFSKQERLKSRKTIAQLFKGGNSFVAYPLRVVWIESARSVNPTPDPSPTGRGDVERSVDDTTEEDAVYATSPLPVGEGAGVGLTEAAAQVAISVPKKNFKTAVARNRLKRRIREAYRLHKHELYAKIADRRIALMLMYIAKEELTYAEIEAGVKKLIRKFPS
ncbi:MAG TPA: ribonuclease P protein component [Saprospiraceae bacterium]|nr:ribonuclease P protein component [Saprospiraceae bacterium]